MSTLNGHVAGTINITGQGGTDDYRELTHKPKINNVTLNGDMSLEDLGIPSSAVSDVKVDGMSVVTGNVANITLPDVPVQDVKVDGSSVVNAAGVANITLPEVPEVPVQDVKVDGSSVVNAAGVANITLPDVPVQDVLVDGTSVVDADGNANINIPAGVVLDVEVDGTSVVTDGIAEITMPTVPDELTDLSDVNISTPSNNDVLTYDLVNDKWINAPAQGGGSYPDYSTTEQEICEWLGGVPCYQKTLMFTYTGSGNSNIDISSYLDATWDVIEFSGVITYTYQGNDYVYSSGTIMYYDKINSTHYIQLAVGSSSNDFNICVTLKYIKN